MHTVDQLGARLEGQRLVGAEHQRRVRALVERELVGHAPAREEVVASRAQLGVQLLGSLVALGPDLVAGDRRRARRRRTRSVGRGSPRPPGRRRGRSRARSAPAWRSTCAPPSSHPAGSDATHGTSVADGTDWAISTIMSPVPQSGGTLDGQVVRRGRSMPTAWTAARASDGHDGDRQARRDGRSSAAARCAAARGPGARNSADEVAPVLLHHRPQLGGAGDAPGGGERLGDLVGGEVAQRAAVDALGVGAHGRGPASCSPGRRPGATATGAPARRTRRSGTPRRRGRAGWPA